MNFMRSLVPAILGAIIAGTTGLLVFVVVLVLGGASWNFWLIAVLVGASSLACGLISGNAIRKRLDQNNETGPF